MASITGKNRDQRLIFSQETARASGGNMNKKLCYLLLLRLQILSVKKRSSHIKSKKQNFFVAKVIEASDGSYYRQNLRPRLKF